MTRKSGMSSRLLIQEEPLQVLPSLAVAIGLNEAIIVQQLHYWLGRSEHSMEGKSWIYNTFEQWRAQFPFWGRNTIRRAMYQLEALGIVEATTRFNHNPIDKTWWYTIHYERLDDFCRRPTAHLGPSTAHLGNLDGPSWVDGRPILGRVPEITTENSPPTPTSGGQNTGAIGEHQVSSGQDSAMADVPHTPDHPPLRNSRAAGTSPRQLAAREQEGTRQHEKDTITACPLCDVRGQVELRREDDTVVMLRCPHDRTQLRTVMVAHAYTWPHAPPPTTAGCESSGDDAGRVGHAKSPESVPIEASVQSGATKGRLPSAPAVDPGACEGGPAP